MIVCKMRKACRTDGFFFTKADEWSDAVRTRRKSDARPRPRLPYFRSNSPPPFLLFLQVRPFAMEIDIDTGISYIRPMNRNSNVYVWWKNKIRPLPFSEGGKIWEFGGREGGNSSREILSSVGTDNRTSVFLLGQTEGTRYFPYDDRCNWFPPILVKREYRIFT